MRLDWIIPLSIGGFVVVGYFIILNLDIFGSENLATMLLELAVAGTLAFLVSRYFFKREQNEDVISTNEKKKHKQWVFYEIKRSLTAAGSSLPNREELESFDFLQVTGLNPIERVIFAVNSMKNVKTIINSNTEVFESTTIQEIHRITSNIEKGFTILDKHQAAVETLDDIESGITNIIKMIQEDERKNNDM